MDILIGMKFLRTDGTLVRENLPVSHSKLEMITCFGATTAGGTTALNPIGLEYTVATFKGEE